MIPVFFVSKWRQCTINQIYAFTDSHHVACLNLMLILIRPQPSLLISICLLLHLSLGFTKTILTRTHSRAFEAKFLRTVIAQCWVSLRSSYILLPIIFPRVLLPSIKFPRDPRYLPSINIICNSVQKKSNIRQKLNFPRARANVLRAAQGLLKISRAFQVPSMVEKNSRCRSCHLIRGANIRWALDVASERCSLIKVSRYFG